MLADGGTPPPPTLRLAAPALPTAGAALLRALDCAPSLAAAADCVPPLSRLAAASLAAGGAGTGFAPLWIDPRGSRKPPPRAGRPTVRCAAPQKELSVRAAGASGGRAGGGADAVRHTDAPDAAASPPPPPLNAACPAAASPAVAASSAAAAAAAAAGTAAAGAAATGTDAAAAVGSPTPFTASPRLGILPRTSSSPASSETSPRPLLHPSSRLARSARACPAFSSRARRRRAAAAACVSSPAIGMNEA